MHPGACCCTNQALPVHADATASSGGALHTCSCAEHGALLSGNVCVAGKPSVALLQAAMLMLADKQVQVAALLSLPALCHAASKGVTKLLHSVLAAVAKAAAPESAPPAVKLAAAKALRQLCQLPNPGAQFLVKACAAMELGAAQPSLVAWSSLTPDQGGKEYCPA